MLRQATTLAVVSALASVNVGAQPADPQLEALRRSQFCSRAAGEFMSKPEWKPENQLGASVSHISHYNTRDRRCLVLVTKVMLYPKERELIEMNHIYDPIGGQTIGGKVFVKSMATTPPTTISIVVLRGTQMIRDAADAALTLAWLERLMVE